MVPFNGTLLPKPQSLKSQPKKTKSLNQKCFNQSWILLSAEFYRCVFPRLLGQKRGNYKIIARPRQRTNTRNPSQKCGPRIHKLATYFAFWLSPRKLNETRAEVLKQIFMTNFSWRTTENKKVLQSKWWIQRLPIRPTNWSLLAACLQQ